MLVAGCSAGSTASGPAAGSAAGSGRAAGFGTNARSLPDAAAAPSAASSSSSSSSAVASTTTAQVASPASIIYTAQLSVRAASVRQATAAATRLTQQAGGYVAQETTSAGSRAVAVIQLKIPVTVYASTLGELSSDLGTQLSLTEQAQDVTEQVADVNSQVTSDEAAISQLRALLTHAGSVGGLLSVQNQINVEESSLEQLQAQQRALSSETSYATLTVKIYGPKAAPVVHHKAKTSSPGLTGGAKAGWHALRVTVSWALAVLAAVAPFAVIVALAVFAGFRARRWRRGRLVHLADTGPASHPGPPSQPGQLRD